MLIPSTPMELSVLAVEHIVSYNFKNKKLLEEALTHSSIAESPSYERLEFVGDSAISLAISNHFFLAYPGLNQGELSLLRAANVSTEKLARVAVRLGLYQYVRHCAENLDDMVQKFSESISEEDGSVVYGGLVKAPKVLADIVESVAGAIYVDVDFDLQKLWVIIRGLLEPIVTPDELKAEPQPVTMLYQLCQKHGKQVDIRNWRNGSTYVVSVYVDGNFIASGSSMQKEIARLNAARDSLFTLSKPMDTSNDMDTNNDMLTAIAGIGESFEIEEAKRMLYDFCCKKRWPKPNYSTEKDLGPKHEKRYVCSVKIATSSGEELSMSGDQKSRIKDSQNSAASLMIRALKENNFI